MAPFLLAIFLSAFLLFQLQPIGATDPEKTAHQTCFRHRLNGIQ